MSNSDNAYKERGNSNTADMKLEKFKKTAFEIIECKDKIIKLLYTILEVQGITTLNLKEFISSNTSSILKDQLLEQNNHGFKTNKKKMSSRKRAILDMQNHRPTKKNKELNIFSTPSKINDNVLSNDFSKLSNYNGHNQQQQQPKQPKQQKQQKQHQEEHQELQQQHQQLQRQLADAMNGHMISARKHNSSLKKNFIESCKKANETLKMKNNENEQRNENVDKNCKSDSHVTLYSSEKAKKISNPTDADCQVCLMPHSESLHGSFPPLLFKLSCGHVFHLMCLYETIIRRECRKSCCICHNELNHEDKNAILNKVKLEKKANDKKNKRLLKVMQMQATRD